MELYRAGMSVITSFFFFLLFFSRRNQAVHRVTQEGERCRSSSGGRWGGGGVGGVRLYTRLYSENLVQTEISRQQSKQLGEKKKKNYLGTRNAQHRFGRVGHSEIQLRSAKLLAKYSPLLPPKKEKEKKERQKTLFVLSRVQQFPPPPPLFFFSMRKLVRSSNCTNQFQPKP